MLEDLIGSIIGLVVFPLVFGAIVVVWLTPLSAIVLLGYLAWSGKWRLAPFGLTLCLYGFFSTLCSWHLEGVVPMGAVLDAPQLFLLPQLAWYLLAYREIKQIETTGYKKSRIYGTLFLSAVTMYWIALVLWIGIGV